MHLCRSSHWRWCSVRKGVLRNFAKFTEKHMCQSLSFCRLRAATLRKNRLWHRCFHVNYAIFPRTPFLQNNSGWQLLPLEMVLFHAFLKVFLISWDLKCPLVRYLTRLRSYYWWWLSSQGFADCKEEKKIQKPRNVLIFIATTSFEWSCINTF